MPSSLNANSSLNWLKRLRETSRSVQRFEPNLELHNALISQCKLISQLTRKTQGNLNICSAFWTKPRATQCPHLSMQTSSLAIRTDKNVPSYDCGQGCPFSMRCKTWIEWARSIEWACGWRSTIIVWWSALGRNLPSKECPGWINRAIILIFHHIWKFSGYWSKSRSWHHLCPYISNWGGFNFKFEAAHPYIRRCDKLKARLGNHAEGQDKENPQPADYNHREKQTNGNSVTDAILVDI